MWKSEKSPGQFTSVIDSFMNDVSKFELPYEDGHKWGCHGCQLIGKIE
jgi:hypothetical protein